MTPAGPVRDTDHVPSLSDANREDKDKGNDDGGDATHVLLLCGVALSRLTDIGSPSGFQHYNADGLLPWGSLV